MSYCAKQNIVHHCIVESVIQCDPLVVLKCCLIILTSIKNDAAQGSEIVPTLLAFSEESNFAPQI